MTPNDETFDPASQPVEVQSMTYQASMENVGAVQEPTGAVEETKGEITIDD
mgnify:CR=1 FL=1